MIGGQRFVDAHVHVWEPDRLHYQWLGGLPALNGPFLPEDLPEAAGRRAGAVFVQADCREDEAQAEVDWVLDQYWPELRAVVGFAPIESGQAVEAHLAPLMDQKLVKGVRRLFQDSDSALITAPATIAGARAVAQAGLRFDACIRWRQLDSLIRFARLLPELPIVLDHMGKPPIAGGTMDQWCEGMRRLARLENVSVKLSGAAPEADPGRPLAEQALPFLSETLSLFGASRCMLGSDWPVSSGEESDYTAWIDLVLATALAGATEEERNSVAGGTAARFYGFAPFDEPNPQATFEQD